MEGWILNKPPSVAAVDCDGRTQALKGRESTSRQQCLPELRGDLPLLKDFVRVCML